MILNIETATKNCSVCIANKGEIIAVLEINDGSYSHAEKLHELIENCIRNAGLNFSDLEAIAVSKGPGSYTGLRIGVSAAKGLCFALDIPLIAVPTLSSLAKSTRIEEGYIIPLLDARRMEVYSSVLNKDYHIIEPVKAEIIDENSFQSYLSSNKVLFLGDGAEKCKGVLSHPNASFLDDKFPSSKEMAEFSYKLYVEKQFEDLAYFEPFYLKDFIGTVSKKI